MTDAGYVIAAWSLTAVVLGGYTVRLTRRRPARRGRSGGVGARRVTAPARARPPQSRTRYIAAASVCGIVVIVAIVLLVVLADNVVFYRTVSEAVKERSSQGTSRFRLAGAVVPGTVKETRVGVDFQVTDGKHTVRVVNTGSPPELFKPRAPVVCEGRWARGLTFASDRILIKHGAQYTPPKVNSDKAPKVSKDVRATLGILGIAIGIGASAVGIVFLLRGVLLGNTAALRQGRICAFVVLLGALVSVGAMEWALISHDFSIRYVADNNARATPLLFTITGLWAALEGSILLWVLILGGYLSWMAHRFRRRIEDPMVGWALIVGLTVALFFFVFMAVAANPFTLVNGVAPLDGRGPNPLLQNHPLMAFHPPMLYLGYVGFTVPFSFAMAALITGRFGEGWLADTRRTTLFAWGFLTVGIILGAWWSYEVLGWGGYWGWDPVENASLLPWITATAFIHSVMVQERRGMLRVWNLSLVVATFCLTILGTFLTRSGIVNSVHAFTQSSIGPWLLTFLFIVMFTGVGLIAWRADKLHAPGRIDSPISREAAFLANNLLFAALAFVVLLGTVFPLLAEALRGSTLSVGEPYFDRMGAPIGLMLLFLMAVAPALPWRATSTQVLQNRLLLPAIAGVATMLLTVVAWTRDWTTVVAFGLAAFTVTAIARETFVAVRARRRADDVGWGRALGRTYAGNPRRYGGLVVHSGVVAIAVVLAAGGSFGTKQEVRLTRGGSAAVGGYRITYVDRRITRSPQKNVVAVDLKVTRGGDDLGTYAPAISTFPNSTTGIGTPSVRTGLLEDVYLTLVSSPNESGRVTIGVQTEPMTLWLWIGGGLMAIGTIMALAPRVRRRVSVERIVVPPSGPTPPANGDGPGAEAQGERPDPDPIGAGAPV